ncbi:hypothetical protein P5673_014141 [Acropora cervicornis]|uniref:Uncharacterized protein n=1 Tax=Acropora cervicornis TaxID=6130 RepID=A0AAD9QJM1_ACRCE|nr:hypothetical protein P5673_014141 [Acropora cervicornis]
MNEVKQPLSAVDDEHTNKVKPKRLTTPNRRKDIDVPAYVINNPPSTPPPPFPRPQWSPPRMPCIVAGAPGISPTKTTAADHTAAVDKPWRISKGRTAQLFVINAISSMIPIVALSVQILKCRTGRLLTFKGSSSFRRTGAKPRKSLLSVSSVNPFPLKYQLLDTLDALSNKAESTFTSINLHFTTSQHFQFALKRLTDPAKERLVVNVKSVKANSSPKAGFLLSGRAVVAICKAWKDSGRKAHGCIEPPSKLLDS